MWYVQPDIPPLIKQLSEMSKNPLATIKKLQDMKVLGKKPLFPKIIVFGEKSAGASLIGTLVGLDLPSCLGVSITLKFNINSALHSQRIWFEFRLKDAYYEKEVSETCLVHEIAKLVEPVPEDERSFIEITLNVTQPHVCDLMIILLPEIHTHADKYKEQREIEFLEGYIRRFTSDDECLFLNVLSCSSNINSCPSSKVLRGLDYYGTQTITVFTKLDWSSEYMIKQSTSKKIEFPTPFGYFFLDDIMEDDEKTKEFELVSKDVINFIGFDAISKNVVIAMFSIMFSPSSPILKRIELNMEKYVLDIKQCQNTFDTVSGVIPMMLPTVNKARNSLYDVFIAQAYGDYEKEDYMHVTSNMALQFTRFRSDLQDLKLDNNMPFLQFENKLLDSRNPSYPSICVPSGISNILFERQLSYASSTIDTFVSRTMCYINKVVMKVLLDSERDNQQFHQFLKRIGSLLVKSVHINFTKKVEEMLLLEKKFLFTCRDEYSRKVKEMESVKLELNDGRKFTSIEGLGNNIRVDHLKSYPEDQIQLAFELKKQIVVYWEFVVNRLVDYFALNLQSLIYEMVTTGFDRVVKEHLMNSIEDDNKFLNPEPTVATHKANLERSVDFLQKAKKDFEKWQVKYDHPL